MMQDRLNYEYEFELQGPTAPARVARMVGANRRVLEVGAGPGSITRVLHEHQGCTVVGLERDANAIAKLSRYCERVIQADLNDQRWTEAVVPLGHFDVLVCADVLEHVLDPLQVLKQLAGLMHDDTSIVVSLPHVGHAAIHACLHQSNFEYRDWGLLDRTHLRFFGIENIAQLFQAAELRIVQAEFVTKTPPETEFSKRWESLPLLLRQQLLKSPYSNVYQVVVKAQRASGQGPSLDLRSVPPPKRIYRGPKGMVHRVMDLLL
jgi:2-polyprenyl-3-methyl-5-hydroxy-6-metoxy-1,4-benzoquinol methylase